MDESDLKFGGEKLFVWALIFLGGILSILTGFMVGTYALPIFVVIVAMALSITWIAGARERWWLLVPVWDEGQEIQAWCRIRFVLGSHVDRSQRAFVHASSAR